MRKIIIAVFSSIDGVMQAPGGPEEDTAGGFAFGGWTFPLFDEAGGAAIGEMFSQPFDLLLGRKTYDIFASYWPNVEHDPKSPKYDEGNAFIGKRFDEVTKYVATHRPESLAWKNSRGLGSDVVASLRALKKEDGPSLLTQGSSELLHLLLENDLADEINLMSFPVILGKGKRVFRDQSTPGALKLAKSTVTPAGVVIARYERAGAVKTGSFV